MTKKTIANMQVKIGGDAKELQSSFAKAQGYLKTFTVGMAAVTTTVAAAFTGLTMLTNKAADYADKIDKSSIKTGLARKTLQELSYVADQAGIDYSSLEGSVVKLNKSMGDVEAGSTRQIDAFKKLGVEIYDNNGKMRQMSDIYPEVISNLTSMDNETERNALAMELLGRNATSVIPHLAALGKDGLQNLMKKADDLNLVMGDKSIATLVAYKDNMSTLKQQMTQTVNQAMTPYAKKFNELAPAISRGVKALGDFVSIPVSDTIREEKTELNLLSKSLIAAWGNEDQRKRMLDEITKKYPAFLDGLDSEKIKLDDIKTRLEQVNKQYVERIRLSIVQEDAAKKEKEMNSLLREQDDLVKAITDSYDYDLGSGKSKINSWIPELKRNAESFDEMLQAYKRAYEAGDPQYIMAEKAQKKYAKIQAQVKANEVEMQTLLGKRLSIEDVLNKEYDEHGNLITDNSKKAADAAEKEKAAAAEKIKAVKTFLAEMEKAADLDDAELNVYVNYKTEGGLSSDVKKFDDIDTDGLIAGVDTDSENDAQSLVDDLASAGEKVKSEIDSMNSAIASGMANMVSTFAEGFGQLATGDIGFGDFFNSILSQFGGFVKQFGEMLIAYGIAEQAFLSSMDPFTKIAAGVALVAIGAALTSLSSSGPSGSSSTPDTSATYGSYASANTSSSIPASSSTMPSSSGDNQMVIQVEMETALRSDHIALMAKKGAKSIIRRG